MQALDHCGFLFGSHVRFVLIDTGLASDSRAGVWLRSVSIINQIPSRCNDRMLGVDDFDWVSNTRLVARY
ncbi:MAG: hypothetical protein ACR2NN_12495 [Bryobacteraceae bacterium]